MFKTLETGDCFVPDPDNAGGGMYREVFGVLNVKKIYRPLRIGEAFFMLKTPKYHLEKKQLREKAHNVIKIILKEEEK
jgi:hypothetical protein